MFPPRYFGLPLTGQSKVLSGDVPGPARQGVHGFPLRFSCPQSAVKRPAVVYSGALSLSKKSAEGQTF